MASFRLFCDMLQNSVFNGKKLYIAFIDYRKAFDFIDRVSLWDKMIAAGINGKILQVIYNL